VKPWRKRKEIKVDAGVGSMVKKCGPGPQRPQDGTEIAMDTNNMVQATSFNYIFSKVGRFKSVEVVINLLRSKCILVLLYGVEACPFVRDKTFV